MKRKVLIFSVAAITAVWVGCTYKKEVNEVPVTVTPPACDTSNVKYSVQVTAILSASCYSCHAGSAGAGAGITLDRYNIIKAYASSGDLMNVVTHAPGYSPMPKGGGKLSDCNIAILRTWVRNGAPNN